MAKNNVFANGHELACKAGDGVSALCFPDICFISPSPTIPPIPFPNTAKAKDTKKGSKTVRISNKQVMLKDRSFFKSSTGNEPAKGKKGLITSARKGKAYFRSWSMNVKIEGYNVCRDIDSMTHNHNPAVGNTGIWKFIDSSSIPEDCKYDMDRVDALCKPTKKAKDGSTVADNKKGAWKKESCKGKLNYATPTSAENGSFTNEEKAIIKEQTREEYSKDMEMEAKRNSCLNARKCMLVPYDKSKQNSSSRDSNSGCCNGQTAHHLLPNSQFQSTRKDNSTNIDPCTDYTEEGAPCVCAEGTNQRDASHGKIHATSKKAFEKHLKAKGKITYKQSRSAAIQAHNKTFKKPKCNTNCLKAQLDNYFLDKCGKKNINLRPKNGET